MDGAKYSTIQNTTETKPDGKSKKVHVKYVGKHMRRAYLYLEEKISSILLLIPYLGKYIICDLNKTNIYYL